jgi:hypothetical protein
MMSDGYQLGYIHDYEIEIPQGGDFWLPIGVIAESDQGVEYLLDTTGYTAAMTVRDEDYDGAAVLEATTANGRIVVGYTPEKWEATTEYAVGQQVVPTELNGFIYECTVGGTSDSGEPTWPTTLNATVVDDGVTWRCELIETVDNGLVSNCYVQVLAAVTELLEDWGRGVYTLQLVDTFGHTVFWMDGVARLRRETVY